jgi:hypothetical protein
VAVAVAVSVAVDVDVEVTVAVEVAVTVAVLVAVAVLVRVGVSDAIMRLMVLENAQAEPNPIKHTNAKTNNNRFISKFIFTPK